MINCIIYTSYRSKMIKITKVEWLRHVAIAGVDAPCRIITLCELKGNGKKGRLKRGG